MRVISLASGGGTLALDGSEGVQARLKVRGLGLPDVGTQWFEGAGDGATHRATRVLPRTIDVPMKVTGQNRDEVQLALSKVAKIVAPTAGDVRLGVLLDGEEWYAMVRRTGGGDYTMGEDSDGVSFCLFVITFRAGDPYWQRANEESRVIVPGGLGKGLLRGIGSLQGLELSTTSGLGTVAFTNAGDVDAYPVWTVTAPFTTFTLTGPAGEVLNYNAAKATGSIIINTELGTVVDEAGVNKYASLGPAPQFWTVPPGASAASIVVPGAVGGSTEIRVYWS
jgi:hypothetical protein